MNPMPYLIYSYTLRAFGLNDSSKETVKETALPNDASLVGCIANN